jgi:hypothetical protein
MSQENVELHERAVAALNARDISDETAAEILAPDYRIENTSTAVTDKTYLGAEGAREWITDFLEAFQEGARYEIEENIADGDDFVVALVRLVGHGARSGAPICCFSMNARKDERFAANTAWLLIGAGS